LVWEKNNVGWLDKQPAEQGVVHEPVLCAW